METYSHLLFKVSLNPSIKPFVKRLQDTVTDFNICSYEIHFSFFSFFTTSTVILNGLSGTISYSPYEILLASEYDFASFPSLLCLLYSIKLLAVVFVTKPSKIILILILTGEMRPPREVTVLSVSQKISWWIEVL